MISMAQQPPTDPALDPEPPRRRGLRLGSFVLWYAVPAFAALAVVAYIAGLVVWHANPPIVPVAGVSMRPTLHAGDLVVVKGVDPTTLRKGDIIAFRTPQFARDKYGLPAALVHRIVSVKKDPTGLVFRTKGDANPGPDVFQLHGDDVVGKDVLRLPGAGYPLLFFRSKQGKIFLGALAVVIVAYFLLGFVEERRLHVQTTALTVEAVLAETRELKKAISSERLPDVSQPVADLPPERPHLAEFELAPAYREVEPDSELALPGPQVDFAQLEAEIHRVVSASDETRQTMGALVGAIGEYGEHLRSHTAVMQNLAATTEQLYHATAELRAFIAAGATPSAPPAAPAIGAPEPEALPAPAPAASQAAPVAAAPAPAPAAGLELPPPVLPERLARAVEAASGAEAELRSLLGAWLPGDHDSPR